MFVSVYDVIYPAPFVNWLLLVILLLKTVPVKVKPVPAVYVVFVFVSTQGMFTTACPAEFNCKP